MKEYSEGGNVLKEGKGVVERFQKYDSPTGYQAMTTKSVKISRLHISKMADGNVILAKRDVLISDIKSIGRTAWGNQNWRQRAVNCSCVIDTGFNGGSWRIYNWLLKYIGYFRNINQKAEIRKTMGRIMRFCFWESRI